MQISPQDKLSPLWRDLRAHLSTRLETLRAQNDGDLNPVDTAKKRGQITEIKALLAIGEERARPAPTD